MMIWLDIQEVSIFLLIICVRGNGACMLESSILSIQYIFHVKWGDPCGTCTRSDVESLLNIYPPQVCGIYLGGSFFQFSCWTRIACMHPPPKKRKPAKKNKTEKTYPKKKKQKRLPHGGFLSIDLVWICCPLLMLVLAQLNINSFSIVLCG